MAFILRLNMNTEEFKPIIKRIGLSVVAERMGYTPQRVNNYLKRGFPDGEILNFCKAIEFEKTPHQVHPGMYPNPNDGLPDHFRESRRRRKTDLALSGQCHDAGRSFLE
jgi:hypothetical protein